LKKDECKQILESVYNEVILGQVQSLEAKVELANKKHDEEEQSDDESPEMADFL